MINNLVVYPPKKEDYNCIIESFQNLKAENQSLSEQVDMLTNCILEMSEMIYS